MKTKKPETYNQQWPTYASMKEMAAQLEVPISVLKRAKSGGCAFVSKSSRCDSLAFTKWMCLVFNDNSNTDWKADKAKSDALMRRIDLEKAKKEVIDFATVDRFISSLVENFVFGALSQRDQRLPGVLKGMDEVTIHAKLIESTEEIKAALKTKLQEMKNV